MERALSQLDVITYIMTYISNGDLTRLARTSRVISGVALDRLWREVNILVLARCMPSQYWDEIETYTPYPDPEPGESTCGNAPDGEYTSRLVLSAQGRSGDWLGPRFRAHAARVRSFDTNNRVVHRDRFPIRPSGWLSPLGGVQLYDDDDDDDDPFHPDRKEPNDLWTILDSEVHYYVTSSLDSDVLHAWHAYSQEMTPLFPILTQLQWPTLGMKAWSFLSPLVTPIFSSLVLTQVYHSPFGHSETENRSITEATALEAVTITQNVVSHCLNLNALDLGDAPVTDSSLEFLVGVPLQQLTEFRCNGTLASKCFDFLAALPNLRVLAVNVPVHVEFSRASRVFPALRELYISQSGAAYAEAVIAAIQSPHICTLHLRSFDWRLNQQHVDHRGALLRAIANHASGPCLRDLYVNDRYGEYAICPTGTSADCYLRLDGSAGELDFILKLSNLQRIKIGLCGKDILSVLRTMLQAWPGLQTLEVAFMPSSEALPLSEFVDIIRGRSSLKNLSGDIHVACSPRAPPSFTSDERFGFVRDIKLHVDKIDDPGVARAPLVHFLMQTFPNLNFAWNVALHSAGDDLASRLAAEAARRTACRRGDWGLHQYRECEQGIKRRDRELDDLRTRISLDVSSVRIQKRPELSPPLSESVGL